MKTTDFSVIDQMFSAMLSQNESKATIDALRQKALRCIRDYGHGKMKHGMLLRHMHVEAETLRRIIETLVQSEMITAQALSRGGYLYTLMDPAE